MSRWQKAFGLLGAVVLALGIFGSQSVSGYVFHEFKVGASAADITATGDPTSATQTFFASPGGSSLTCNNVHLEGSLLGESWIELELTPTFTECSAAGFPASISDSGNGCRYRIGTETLEDSKTTEENVGLVENGAFWLSCIGGTGELAANVAFIGCFTRLSDRSKGGATVNQGLHGVRYVNTQTSGEPETVTAEIHIHGIHYESSGCGLAGVSNGTHTTGTLIGKVTIKAYGRGSEHDTTHQINATMVTP